MTLVGPARFGRDLFRGQTPFLDMAYRKAETDQHIEIGRQGPMLLEDAFCEPIGRAVAFIQIRESLRARVTKCRWLAPSRLRSTFLWSRLD